MRKILLFLVLLPLSVFSQNCSCEDNFEWLKKTFEENDAGFQYVIDMKGDGAYTQLNDEYRKKVKAITKDDECVNTLKEWLLFFRSGHLSLNVAGSRGNTELPDAKQIIEKYKGWEQYSISEKEFKKYLSLLKEPGFEGIWISEPYTIGIIKREKEYIGFVMNSNDPYWKNNQIKLRIKPNKSGDGFEAVYYMKDHSIMNVRKIDKVGNNTMFFDWISFKRLYPEYTDTKSVKEYLELNTSSNPVAKQISKNTFLLRIPSFSEKKRKMIDSLIVSNRDMISRCENLIIDIRNNGGGSDSSFQKLIPYLYTNPIRSIGVDYLSTPLNNKRMDYFIASDDFTETDKKWARKGLVKLNNNLGKFVNLEDSDEVQVSKLDKISEYPKNVAILINENNGSTAEEFLLLAKQSKKVKLFGTTTAGVLDISNMNFVDSPCKTLQLGYGLSRSRRIPDIAIDTKGIQPDYYIDKTIPSEDWIDFTEKILLNE
ncbi:S41 family peptidase [Flavobacterium cerinum]|uniref:Peptidase S41 n=1 Tax=Flavobacterium cerinum TaxID=2502784 RepID=A0A3S3SG22_9FLAO|nr:S41 family peptidase [Flavobacterium cerinum]RWX02245.1 peptidase S41 [Flavobacterium cerinum]